MDKVWIVLADGAQARIFSAEGRVGHTLTEVDDLVHPETRLAGRDLDTSAPGRSWSPTGDGRHAMEDATSPHQKERELFARELATRLNRDCQGGRFQHLLLAAPAGFLGLLRPHLDTATARVVSAEVTKNLVREKPEDARRLLPDFLY